MGAKALWKHERKMHSQQGIVHIWNTKILLFSFYVENVSISICCGNNARITIDEKQSIIKVERNSLKRHIRRKRQTIEAIRTLANRYPLIGTTTA